MDLKTLIEFDAILPVTQARLLAGPAGIGKSSAVKIIAQNKGMNFVDLRLSELEPADLVGMPFIDGKGTSAVTRYAAPAWWNELDNAILFLDEVDRCREDMQPLAMQLTLDRRAGGRDLPKNTIVYAACNGEKYMTAAIDQALINRFAFIDFRPTVAEWLQWAEKANVHPAVVSFIRSNNLILDTPDEMIGKANIAVPTRRSWASFGFALNNIKEDITKLDYVHIFAKPFVGIGPATQFGVWVKEKFQVVSPQDVFTGKLDPANVSAIQISQVLDEVIDIFMDDKTSKDQRHKCLKFFKEAGAEIFGAFFAKLPSSASMIIHQFPDIYQYIADSIRRGELS